MNVVIGGIYEMSNEWHPYDVDIFNNRPVIVISKSNLYVEIVLMNAVHSSSKRQYDIMVEVNINSRKHFVAIACDIVHQVAIRDLKSCIGYVNHDVIELIIDKRKELYNANYEQKAKTIHSNKINSEANGNKPKSGENSKSNEEHSDAFITNIQKFEELMSGMELNINKNIDSAKTMIEKSQSPPYIWKERIIGFVFGVVASICANAIWELDWDSIQGGMADELARIHEWLIYVGSLPR